MKLRPCSARRATSTLLTTVCHGSILGPPGALLQFGSPQTERSSTRFTITKSRLNSALRAVRFVVHKADCHLRASVCPTTTVWGARLSEGYTGDMVSDQNKKQPVNALNRERQRTSEILRRRRPSDARATSALNGPSLSSLVGDRSARLFQITTG